MRETPANADAPFESRPSTFQEYLARLKRTGSGLLVTGETPEWVQQHASRQLFGTTRPHGDERPRRRLVVQTAQSFDAASYLPTGASLDDENVAVVAASHVTRGAAAASGASGTNSSPGGLSGLTERVVAGIEGLAVDVQPGELRVGVTSLLPLVETAGLASAVEFYDTVATAVREHAGMAHAHCPLPETDGRLDRFHSVVDGRVELRQEGTNPVQCRWETPYPELNTDQQWVDFV